MTEEFNYTKLKTSLGIVIAVFAFALYAQSVTFNYTLDDYPSIKDNKITTQGLHGIPALLTTDYGYGFSETNRGRYYRPASMVLFAIEWQFFPNNPHIAHLVNVVLYSLTCWLLFILLCKLFSNHPDSQKKEGRTKKNLLIPFVCSLLYVSHPIHTEVIDSIKSCDEILAFLFSIITTLLIIQYLKNKSVLKLILASVVYFIALLSKETSITFLAAIPLIAFVFTKSTLKEITTVTLSLALVTGAYLIIRRQILQDVPGSLIENAMNNSLLAAPDFISQRVTAFYILLRYIFLLIIPYPLTYDYGYSQIKIHGITDAVSSLGIVVYLGLVIYSILNIRKKNLFAFAILFYLITLSITSNIFFLFGATMGERFLYIPSLGYCLLVTLLLSKFIKKEVVIIKSNKPIKAGQGSAGLKEFFAKNSFLFGIAFVVTAALSIRTVARSRDWKDNATLYSHDIKISDNSANAHYNWALTMLRDLYPVEKNENKKNDLLDKSISEFKRAIDINYSQPQVYFAGIAEAYSKKNDHQNAIINYEKAIKLASKSDWTYYDNLGHEYLYTGQFDKAVNMEDSAIKYKPDCATAYSNKGSALGAMGKYEESILCFLKAIALDSLYADAYKNLGASYFHIRQYSKAIDVFNKSLEIDSTDARTINYIGLAYIEMGDSLKSKAYIEKYNTMRATGN